MERSEREILKIWREVKPQLEVEVIDINHPHAPLIQFKHNQGSKITSNI